MRRRRAILRGSFYRVQRPIRTDEEMGRIGTRRKARAEQTRSEKRSGAKALGVSNCWV